jgi:hypothetical protein
MLILKIKICNPNIISHKTWPISSFLSGDVTLLYDKVIEVNMNSIMMVSPEQQIHTLSQHFYQSLCICLKS